MGLYNEPVSNIRSRLKDWLIVNPFGGNVANLDLDLLNRANQWLQSYRQWDMLTTTVTLIVDGNRQSQLPYDVKSILEVYVDNAVVGKPNIWFYEDCPDVAFRYTKEFICPVGGTRYWCISWPSVSPLLSSPKLKYCRLLDDFTGAGPEISFFPAELMLRTAQKVFAEEKGLTGDNIQGILTSFQENLKIFEQMAQANNQQPDLTPKNKFGQPIKIYGHSLDGRQLRTGFTPYTPAQQAGFHGF